MDWRDIPSLQALRGFEAAARCGSYAAAARALNVTHAAIAQHVRRLEDHFGRRLMRRTGAGMEPTEAGAALAATLTEGFGIVGAGVRDLMAREAAAPLRIALTPSLAANWLMPRLGAFWTAHPDIALDLAPSPELVDLRARGVDLAIRYGRGPWPGAVAERLMEAGHAVVARPGLAPGPVPDLSVLSGETWLLETHSREDRLWAARHGLDLDRATVREFPFVTYTLEAVRAGYGVAILPRVIAEGAVARGEIEILFSEEDGELAYHMLTRPDRVSPELKAFMSWLRRQAAG